jgi:AcrR family transcriptional regulator
MPAPPSRDQILVAARTAFANEKTPSMADIAAATGTSLRRLYRFFGSRENLLRELDQEPPPGARERILEAALELLGESGLTDLPMDELAARAEVSRATLYRLFPGKSALFRELIMAYSPWEPIARVLESSRASNDTQPAHVIPQVARALVEAMSGRMAVLIRMVFEMGKGDPDTAEGVHAAMTRGLPDLIEYMTEQMCAGWLRRVHPVLAFQLLAGPIVAHELTRPLAALLGFDIPRKQVVDQIVEFWLRAMSTAPANEEKTTHAELA